MVVGKLRRTGVEVNDQLNRCRESLENPPLLIVSDVTETVKDVHRTDPGMQVRGEDPHLSAHYLMQLLFYLFAEEVPLLPNTMISKMVAAGIRRPDLFTAHASELITAINMDGTVAHAHIPRFNGGLFATDDVPRPRLRRPLSASRHDLMAGKVTRE